MSQRHACFVVYNEQKGIEVSEFTESFWGWRVMGRVLGLVYTGAIAFRAFSALVTNRAPREFR